MKRTSASVAVLAGITILSVAIPCMVAHAQVHLLSTRIDSLMQEYNRAGVPGASVAIVRDGRVLFRQGYGLADLEERTPATPSTNYRLASVTKQFTAMAVLILKERGLLSLDQSLNDLFDDFPDYGRDVTVRHLLHHTSGLQAYEEIMPETTTVQVLDSDVLAMMKRVDCTFFKPGTEFRYSNSGYAVLAQIVEKVSGMSFARFLAQNIFAPVGMAGTVAYEKGVSTVPNRAFGYSRREQDGHEIFERTDQSSTSAVLGDGGVYSSTEDLIKWDQALYTDKFVRLESLREAFTPYVLPNDTSTRYGFGWYVDDYRGLRRIHHEGSTVGFRTAIQRFPEKKFCVIVLVNRSDAEPEKLASRIADMELFGD